MNDHALHRGSCLCGAVQLAVHLQSLHVDVCHCSMCRKWGGPFFSVGYDGALSIEGEQHVRSFPSSDWAERAFCANCGTHLYYHLAGTGHYALPPGLFDPAAKWQLREQIFIEEKPAWYDFANTTANLTGAEVFARFTGESDE